jgi:hypothetical protein
MNITCLSILLLQTSTTDNNALALTLFITSNFEKHNLLIQQTASQRECIFCVHNIIQLVAKKTGNENFPNVNLILSICQLIVYLTIPIK